MIRQRNISLISNRTAADGGRRIPEDVIERDYCIAWFLVALATSSLGESLAFKGGTALRRCHFKDYRFSEDMDFTIVTPVSKQELLAGFEETFREVQKRSGIVFKLARQDPDGQSSHTFYFSYVGPLPGAPREVKVDVTFREKVVTATERLPVIRTYDEYEDLPGDVLLLTYSLEEVLIEKIAALSDRARTEPRDLYDLWRVAAEVALNYERLPALVTEKILFKGDKPAARAGNLEKKETRLRVAWEKRLSHQMANLPEFDEVLREVRRIFRRLEIFDPAPDTEGPAKASRKKGKRDK